MQSLVVEDSAYSKLTDAMICEIEAKDQEKGAEDRHQLEDKSYEDEGASGCRLPINPIVVDAEKLDRNWVVEDSAYSKLRDAMICDVEANDQEKRAEDWHQLEEKSYVDGAFGSPVHTQLHDFIVPKEEGEAEKWNANPASPASLSISHKRPCYGWIKSDDEEPTQLKDTDSVVVPIKVEAENWNANPASLPLSHERPCYGLSQASMKIDFFCMFFFSQASIIQCIRSFSKGRHCSPSTGVQLCISNGTLLD